MESLTQIFRAEFSRCSPVSLIVFGENAKIDIIQSICIFTEKLSFYGGTLTNIRSQFRLDDPQSNIDEPLSS